MVKIISTLVTLGCIALGSAASAYEMGGLSAILRLGDLGVFEATDVGDFYVLENNERDNAVYYVQGKTPRENHGFQSASVEFEFREETDSTRAGLIFGFDEADNSYFFFAIGPKGEIILSQRTPSGFRTLFEGGTNDLIDGVNVLTLEETAEGVRLALNDDASITSQRPGMAGGGIGIIAIGMGEVGFTNYSYHAE